MDKVVDLWNKGPGKKDQITVTVKKQASGDTLVTKILTAHKAGKAPDLVQAEYQALPTLVSNDALADIAKNVGDVKGKFADGVWQQTTLGTDAVYAVPQDIGPMMFYYREDLFKEYGLTVPTTWEQFAQTARALKKKSPETDLTTFSANDSGLFAGLAQQAKRQVVDHHAATSGRSASTTRRPRRSPTSGAASSRRAPSTTSRCTPRPGTRRSTPASRSPGSAPCGRRAP